MASRRRYAQQWAYLLCYIIRLVSAPLAELESKEESRTPLWWMSPACLAIKLTVA